MIDGAVTSPNAALMKKGAIVVYPVVYSRDSGNTYYAVIAMQGPNSLQVEACALGKFFCSGKMWSRVEVRPQDLISARQIPSSPRS